MSKFFFLASFFFLRCALAAQVASAISAIEMAFDVSSPEFLIHSQCSIMPVVALRIAIA
jgi:hypothetical protein